MARSSRLFSKFYWQDWLTDPALRLVSFGARGLWMDLLSLMWMSTKQGFLVVNGVSPTNAQIGRLTGGGQRDVDTFLRELEEANVFSRDESGTIYSRRMVRDIDYREQQRENGKRGGNPALLDNHTLNPDDNHTLNLEDNNGDKVLEAEAETEATSPLIPKGKCEKEQAVILRARSLFRMRESTPLDHKQKTAWKKNKAAVVATTEEDWLLLEWWFSDRNPAARFRRHDLLTLLNNWNGEITRAATEARKSGMRFSAEKKELARPALVEPEEWRPIYAVVMGDECPVDIAWDVLPDTVRRRIVDAQGQLRRNEESNGN